MHVLCAHYSYLRVHIQRICILIKRAHDVALWAVFGPLVFRTLHSSTNYDYSLDSDRLVSCVEYLPD